MKYSREKHANKEFGLGHVMSILGFAAIGAVVLSPLLSGVRGAMKKSTALTSAKRISEAIILYSSDQDGEGPCGLVPNLSDPSEIRFRVGDYTAQSPAGWFNYPLAQGEYALVWHNSTAIYRQEKTELNPPGTRVINIVDPPWPGGYAHPQLAPQGVNFTYNGLLQSYSFLKVANPRKLALLWQGIGDLSFNGAAMANPRLNCNGSGPCAFNPLGMPQKNATGFQGSYFNIILNCPGQVGAKYWTVGQGSIEVGVDGSARYVEFGRGNRGIYPASTNSVDPIESFASDGTVPCESNFIRGRYTPDRAHIYVAAFAPDNGFEN